MHVYKRSSRMWNTETMWNTIVILFFFENKTILVASQNYGWTPDVTWIILPISLLRFWTWEHFSCVAVYGGSESSQIKTKTSNLCSENERRSYGFGMTSGWVINDITFIFGWTNPLRNSSKSAHLYAFWRIMWLDKDWSNGCWKFSFVIKGIHLFF